MFSASRLRAPISAPVPQLRTGIIAVEHGRANWSGVLQFIDRDGHVAEGQPEFQCAEWFRVPKMARAYVAPATPQARYSITGWLRAKNP